MSSKLFRLIPDIDKQGHIWAGWALFLTFALSFGSGLSSLFAALGVGVLREAFGNRDLGDSWRRALASVSACLCGGQRND